MSGPPALRSGAPNPHLQGPYRAPIVTYSTPTCPALSAYSVGTSGGTLPPLDAHLSTSPRSLVQYTSQTCRHSTPKRAQFDAHMCTSLSALVMKTSTTRVALDMWRQRTRCRRRTPSAGYTATNGERPGGEPAAFTAGVHRDDTARASIARALASLHSAPPPPGRAAPPPAPSEPRTPPGPAPRRLAPRHARGDLAAQRIDARR